MNPSLYLLLLTQYTNNTNYQKHLYPVRFEQDMDQQLGSKLINETRPMTLKNRCDKVPQGFV